MDEMCNIHRATARGGQQHWNHALKSFVTAEQNFSF